MDVQEWKNVNGNEPGHSALTEEDIVLAMGRPDKEDKKEYNKLIVDEPDIPSHSKASACLSVSI